MKQLLPLFLLLLPCLALAQYPTNGNQKITLGEQTTADGLIWRGVLADTGIITPSSDTSAYIILDTVNNRFFNYNSATNVWSASGGGMSVSGTSGQVAYFDAATSVTGDAGLIYSAANKTLGINTTTTSGANLIIKNSQEPARSTFLTQQTFAADTTNWTRGTGWTFNGTLAVATAATGNLTYTTLPDTIISGRAYEITYTQSGYSAGTATIALGNVTLAIPQYNVTANIILLLPTSATGGFRITTSTYTGNLDNISIVEITGSAPVIFAGQDDASATLYNSLTMPTSATLAFGGGGGRTTGNSNNFFGGNSGNINTTGQLNNFFGSSTGRNNTSGSNNNFFGGSAGQNNTIGSANNFFGSNAGNLNTTGSNNNFFGTQSGQNNTTGGNNNFFGTQSGQNNTTGGNNNFFGTQSGLSNTTGTSNVFIGLSAGRNNTTGGSNFYFGESAGRANNGAGNIGIGNFTFSQSTATTGSNNIFLGTNAGDNMTGSAANNVVIGSQSDLPDAGGSNQVVIKNIIFATGASGTGTTIAGSVGIGTNAPQAGYQMTVNDSLYVGGRVSSAGYTTRSDYNLKDEIKGINYGLNEIMQIMPVSYTYKSNGEHQLGFIAQDIGVIIPESVHFDEYMGVDYQSIIPILTKAIQEQQALIKALEQRIINLENK
jgi:hypothetical protein